MSRLGQFVVRHRTRILIGARGISRPFHAHRVLRRSPDPQVRPATQLTAALHREVTIAEVRVNPFALSATLRGLAVKEPKGPETFASFEELYLNLEASSLFRWAAVVKEVRLTETVCPRCSPCGPILQLLGSRAGTATAAEGAAEAGALLGQQYPGG